MCGIAAGIEAKVQLGDVLVANPIWDWGSGKWVARDGGQRFLPSAYQLSLDPTIREFLRNLADDPSFLMKLRGDWRGAAPRGAPAIVLGPVASGASVLADAQTVIDIGERHRDLIGVEMEGYAVMAAADEAILPRPKAVIIKSVVDFADGEKNDGFQPYGAYTSARVFQRMVEQIDFSSFC